MSMNSIEKLSNELLELAQKTGNIEMESKAKDLLIEVLRTKNEQVDKKLDFSDLFKTSAKVAEKTTPYVKKIEKGVSQIVDEVQTRYGEVAPQIKEQSKKVVESAQKALQGFAAKESVESSADTEKDTENKATKVNTQFSILQNYFKKAVANGKMTQEEADAINSQISDFKEIVSDGVSDVATKIKSGEIKKDVEKTTSEALQGLSSVLNDLFTVLGIKETEAEDAKDQEEEATDVELSGKTIDLTDIAYEDLYNFVRHNRISVLIITDGEGNEVASLPVDGVDLCSATQFILDNMPVDPTTAMEYIDQFGGRSTNYLIEVSQLANQVNPTAFAVVTIQGGSYLVLKKPSFYQMIRLFKQYNEACANYAVDQQISDMPTIQVVLA